MKNSSLPRSASRIRRRKKLSPPGHRDQRLGTKTHSSENNLKFPQQFKTRRLWGRLATCGGLVTRLLVAACRAVGRAPRCAPRADFRSLLWPSVAAAKTHSRRFCEYLRPQISRLGKSKVARACRHGRLKPIAGYLERASRAPRGLASIVQKRYRHSTEPPKLALVFQK